jgi:hypothetical protein
MSEQSTIYIPCASKSNAFTDCLVVKHGDLIRLVGHDQMDFMDSDAKRLAYAILDLLPASRREPVVPVVNETSGCAGSGDVIVDEIRAMLLDRSKKGQEKYGTTMMRNDLNLIDWMRHAIEESLDRVLYMQRAMKDLESLYDDGR